MRFILTLVTLSVFNVFGQELFVSNDSIVSKLKHEFAMIGIDLTKKSTFIEFNSLSPFETKAILKTQSFTMRTFSSGTNAHFIVRDSISEQVFDGFIIDGFVFIQTKNAFFFNRNILNLQERIVLENAILEKHYPNLQLDSIYFNRVNDKNGDYAGSIEIELKTKTRNGCMISETYELISSDDYSPLNQLNHQLEPVITYFQKADDLFQKEHQFFGLEFHMYSMKGNLIHKGVISEFDWR